jgi:transcriptional pleiotropic regulator of transition state genes
MRYTGVARPIDELGRIVIPKEIRRTLDLKEKVGTTKGDMLDFYVEDDMIIIRKRRTTCTFCGQVTNGGQYMNKAVCDKCIVDFKSKSFD